jgi:maleamate amidohydrolase
MPQGDDKKTNYSAVFDGHLQPGEHPALLLVDIVTAYTDPESPLYCETATDAVEVSARLAQQARAAGCPVVLTNVEYVSGGADGGVFYRKAPVLSVFDRGSRFGAFPDALGAQSGDIIVTKQYPSAFFSTGLDATLHELGVDTLVIGGFSTSGCVRASALDAMQYGFVPFVAREACADRHPYPHEASLFDLQAKYAEVVSATDAGLIFG